MFARVRAREYATLSAYLSPPQAALFRRMDRCDQRHCLDVFYTLYRAGHREDTLLEAALLHDAGKSVHLSVPHTLGTDAPDGEVRRLTVWHRVVVVLMQEVAPSWLSDLASDGRGWKAPFAVHVRHAETSAQCAAEAGCPPTVVALIRGHHTPDPDSEQSAALQWADNQN
jgi:hypothetical protein